MTRERWQKIEQLCHASLEREDTDNYDVSPDGQRFLMIKPAEQPTSLTQIVVVQNWFEELKRRVPTGK